MKGCIITRLLKSYPLLVTLNKFHAALSHNYNLYTFYIIIAIILKYSYWIYYTKHNLLNFSNYMI